MGRVIRLLLFLCLLPAATPALAQYVSPKDVAICSHFTGQPERQIAACTRIIDARPTLNLHIPYMNRGVLYLYTEQLDRAISDLDASVRLNPRYSVAYESRALALHSRGEKGDDDRALADVETALKLSTDPSGRFALLLQKANILRAQGAFDAAKVQYDAAIAANPSHAWPYAGRAGLYRKLGDNARAMEDLNRALALEKFPLGLVARAELHETLGNRDQARADYTQALMLMKPRMHEGKLSDFSFLAYKDKAKVRLALLQQASVASAPPAVLQPQTGPQRKIALVIGNSAYRGTTSLVNPANDARAVADNLRGMGFEVTEGLDLGRAGMDDALRQFLLKAPGARTAFLFYAGHGVQIDGRNYLVPVDADLRHSGGIESDMMALDTILAGLQDSQRANIVVLDACRDDPRMAQAVTAELGRSASVRAGLAAPSSPRAATAAGAGTLLAFATSPGEIALDGDGRNSPFSSALTRHIGTPGLEVQQMFTRVRAEVVASTHNRQVPWTNSSLLGDVYLASR